jgi:adenosylmethionine---8-amino-7-oxononanoate aminotransferase
MTGFGRTGRNFACDHLNTSPDIICLSKGITGGFMPLGATTCNEKIVNAFYSEDKTKTFYHGHSYTANPIACAAANASLDILLSETCQSNIQRIFEQHQKFAEMLKKESAIKNIRHQGTILAMDIDTEESTSYFNSVRDHFYQFCLNDGVLLRPLGNTIYIMPPYVITNSELEKVYAVILKFIHSLHHKKS